MIVKARSDGLLLAGSTAASKNEERMNGMAADLISIPRNWERLENK